MKALDKISILVVDDEEALREILIEELTYHGATVVGADNGTLAFELLKKQTYDVVISDVRMPGGDGINLLKDIDRALFPKPKIFLCTGFSDLSELNAKNLGVLEVFPKPFDMEKMVQSVFKALSKSYL